MQCHYLYLTSKRLAGSLPSFHRGLSTDSAGSFLVPDVVHLGQEPLCRRAYIGLIRSLYFYVSKHYRNRLKGNYVFDTTLLSGACSAVRICLLGVRRKSSADESSWFSTVIEIHVLLYRHGSERSKEPPASALEILGGCRRGTLQESDQTVDDKMILPPRRCPVRTERG